MTLPDYLQPLVRHRLMILLLCLSALVHGTLITYLLSEKYEAAALVLMRPQQEITLGGTMIQKEVLNFPVGGAVQTEPSSKTYTELLQSRTVAEEVVRRLALDTLARQPDPNYFKELFWRAKSSVREALGSAWQILKYGRVIRLDPFTKAVEDLQKGIVGRPTKNSFVFAITYQGKDPALAARIVNETAAVFVSLLTDLGSHEARHAREFIEQSLHRSAADLDSARHALRDFKEQNQSILFPKETAEKIKVISGLESSLAQLEVELSGLTQQFTLSNPKVAKVQAERDRLAADIAGRKADLLALPEREARLAVLELAVKAAENNYSFVSKEYDQARIREATNTSDIRIISGAIPPSSPIKPIKIYYALTAFALALVIGVGNLEEVEQALELPVLATIPLLEAGTPAPPAP